MKKQIVQLKKGKTGILILTFSKPDGAKYRHLKHVGFKHWNT